MKQNYMLIFMLSLLFFGQAQSQQQMLYQHSEPQHLFYTYQSLSGPSAPFVQKMLQQLNPGNFGRSGFELLYEQDFKVFKDARGQRISIEMQFVNMQVLNLPLYKGFDFRYYFLPARLRPTLLVERSRTGEVLVQQPLDYQSTGFDGTSLPFRFDYIDSLAGPNENYIVSFSDVFIEYDLETQKQVRIRCEEIDEYEASLPLLSALEAEVNSFPYEGCDPDSIELWQKTYEAWNSEFTKYGQKSFWIGLALGIPDAHDPLGLLPLYQALEQNLKSQQEHLNYWRNHTHELYVLQAKKHYASGNTERALSPTNKALESKKNYAPALSLRAQIHYKQGKYLDAKKDLQAARQTDVLGSTEDVRNETERLHPLLLAELQKLLNEADAQKKYGKTIQLADEAIDLCKNTTGIITCNSVALEKQREECIRAWYKEAMDISQARIDAAQMHIDSNLFAQSLGELEEAKDSIQSLQKLYKTYTRVLQNRVTEPSPLYPKALDMQYNALLLDGEEKLRNTKREEARKRAADLSALIQAETSLQARKTQVDAFLERVDFSFFELYIAEGDSLQKLEQYSEAKAIYAKAQELDTRYNFSQKGMGGGLEDKVDAAMQASIIARANAKLASTNNEELFVLLAELQGDLAKHPKLKGGAAEQAIGQIEEQICVNARQLIFPEQLAKVKSLRSSKDYIKALEEYKTAEALLEKYKSCAIEDAELKALQEEITLCASFQEEQNKLASQEQMQEFAQALRSAAALKERYLANATLQAQLSPLPQFDTESYLKAHGNHDYVYAGSLYLLEQKNNAAAFDLLYRALNTLQMNRRKTRFVQERLGSWKAEQVFDASRKWKDAFAEVVGPNQRAWSYFRKSFRGRWRQLSK